MLIAIKWNAPQHLVERLGCVLDIDPSSAILDVGAGAGIVGKLLKEKGFSNITGVDASQALLKKAQESGAYKATHCMYFGLGFDKFLDELKGQFDIVTATGCFIEGHIPASGFDDVHAALKTGGHFLINLKECNWTDEAKEGYKAKLSQMIKEGKFKIVDESISYREEWRETEIGDNNKPIGEKIKDYHFILQRLD